MKPEVLSIAVAFIMAVTFAAVMASFVNDVLMAFIAAIIGKPSFDAITIEIGKGTIYIGTFLTTLVNFVIIAFVLFMVVKAADKVMTKKEEDVTTRECPMCLTAIPLAAKRCAACTSEVPAA